MKRSVALLVTAFLTVPLLDGTAQGTFPGSNGRIAFYDFNAFFGPRGKTSQIYSMEPDGSDVRRLTSTTRRHKTDPAWSPDGARIAFAASRKTDPGRGRVVVMDADGQNRQVIVALAGDRYVFDPAWSPDGTQIAFCVTRGRNKRIWVVGADGSNLTRLTPTGRKACYPDWSPDGTRIAFTLQTSRTRSAIATMAPDGSDRELVVPRGTNIWPSWSPDGAMIAFARADDVFIVDVATGSRTRVTNTPRRFEFQPIFSPDGLQVAFTRAKSHPADIWIADVNGSNKTRVTDTPSKDEFQLSWQAV